MVQTFHGSRGCLRSCLGPACPWNGGRLLPADALWKDCGPDRPLCILLRLADVSGLRALMSVLGALALCPRLDRKSVVVVTRVSVRVDHCGRRIIKKKNLRK